MFIRTSWVSVLVLGFSANVQAMTEAECVAALKKCEKYIEDGAALQVQADANATAQQGLFQKAMAQLKGNCPAVAGYASAENCYKNIKDAYCQKKARDGYLAAVDNATNARTACYSGANSANMTQPGSGDQALKEAGLPVGEQSATTATNDATALPTAAPATPAAPTNPSSEPGLLGKAGNLIGDHPFMTMLGAGALGTLIGKKINDTENKSDKTDKNPHALLANGNVDCSVPAESYRYAGCIPNMQNQCKTIALNPTLAAGVDKAVAKSCTDFQTAFCNSSNYRAGTVQMVQVEGNPVPVAVPMLGIGEGRTSDFCKTIAAASFCQTSGMDQCPSCLNLAAKQSAACSADETLCLAQNSPAQLAAALNACPGNDPMKTDPAVLAMLNGTSTTNQFSAVAGGGGGGTGTPTVVLPQSVMAGRSGRTISSQSVGPASDIGAPHGVSAQVIGSAAIQNLCARNQLACR